jgi:hypothetical protein
MQPIVRKVLGLVIIAVLAGCAGQTEQLSMERPQQGTQPQAPQKVYGLGDTYSPKNVPLTQEQRYQNVRIIAVYQTDQVPVVPAAPRS